MKRLDPIADRSNHAFDLMVFALSESQAQLRGCDTLARRGDDWLGIVVEHDARKQCRDVGVGDWMPGRDLVHLGYVMLWRRHAVNELSVVGEDQQPRRVLIQPPDGLHAVDRRLARAVTQCLRQ